mgnify:FL=1
MGEFLEELNPVVKSVFMILISIMLASLLYIVLLRGENSALGYACKAIETPISAYYYEYAFYPSTHVNSGIASALGITTKDDVSDLSAGDIDDADVVARYSTGWK